MSEWYKIQALDAGRARIDMYGYIVSDAWFDDEVSAAGFLAELKAITAETIEVHINSPGGEVTQGLLIYNALINHAAAIETYVDAEAASMASIVAMAGDVRVMAGHAMLMIHNPWGAVSGDAEQVRKYADRLDLNADVMASIYADRCGADKTVILDAMAAETWYSASSAVDAGLATEIRNPIPLAAALARTFPVTACKIEPGRYLNTPPQLLAARTEESKENIMSDTAPIVDPVSAPPPNEELEIARRETAAAHAALAADNDRRRAISARFGRFIVDHRDLHDNCCNDQHCSAEQAAEQLLTALAASSAGPIAGSGRIETVSDARDRFLEGAGLAIAGRAGLRANGKRIETAGNEFRGYSLFELARGCLDRAGISSAGLDRRRVVGMAFSHNDSDFPELLENIANKSLLMGWGESEATYPIWTERGVLTDYKETGRVGIEAFPYLDAVPAGAEYTYATIGSTGEKIQLAKYGGLFSIDREAIINDDTSAFSAIPQSMGSAARATINWQAYNVLIANAAMADGVALFDAAHGNLLTGATIGTDSVDEMRVAMATQTAIGSAKAGTANAGKAPRLLNIRLGYLLVPVALEGTARTVMESQYYVDFEKVDANIPNSVRGIAEVVSDPVLDSADPAAWYGAATRRSVEVAFFDGDEQPYIESREGWNVDGVEYKVRIEAGVKALDYRGLASNPGA